MSEKSSAMPEELKANRDELASNHAFQMMRTMEGASPNTRRDFKAGFDKCYELMIEREAKLKVQLEKAIEQRDKYVKLSCAWAEECYSYKSPTEIINLCNKELGLEL